MEILNDGDGTCNDFPKLSHRLFIEQPMRGCDSLVLNRHLLGLSPGGYKID